jgi:hypothetical protein
LGIVFEINKLEMMLFEKPSEQMRANLFCNIPKKSSRHLPRRGRGAIFISFAAAETSKHPRAS